MSTDKKRGAPPKAVTASVRLNGRITPGQKKLLGLVASHLGTSETAAIIAALERLAEELNIKA